MVSESPGLNQNFKSLKKQNVSEKELVELFNYYLNYQGRRTSQYISKDSGVSLTFQVNTPQGTEGIVEVYPPEGYIFAIRYFKMTTPAEVKGNILLVGLDGDEVRMLSEDQAEGVLDQTYSADDFDKDFFFVNYFKLYGLVTGYDPSSGTTNVVTTADRTITLKFGGGLVRVWSVK